MWVDYNGSLLNVSLAPINIKKPSQHLMSRSINISEIFKDKIFVGFSASTGQLTSNQYILGIFQAPLPRDKPEKLSQLLIGLVCRIDDPCT